MRGLSQPSRQLIKLRRCQPVLQRALTPISPTVRCGSYSSSASNVSSPSTPDSHMDFEAIRAEMMARPPQIHTDEMDFRNARLLTKALSEFLPEDCLPQVDLPQSEVSPVVRRQLPPYFPPGYHLVYFPLGLRGSQLCPDGTDPYHSPRGTPFTRRMWAGGSLQGLRSLKLNGKAAACVEEIADVRAQGPAGSEKIFVEVERNYIYPLSNGPGPKLRYREKIRRFLKNPSQNGRVGIAERRTLVFMREPSDEEKKISLDKEQKILRPPFTPTYSVTLTPTPTFLFHYSALSYNAHRIHLDRSYCREVEGYRDLLVHGPLSLTLMLSVLQSQLPNGDTNGSFIDSVDYRHLAPLYVNQPMRVCCAPRSGNVQDQWSIWVENQDGGLCVMGTAIIKPLTDSKQNETEN